MQKLFGVIAITVWLITGLYMGIGGFTSLKLRETLKELKDNKSKILLNDTLKYETSGLTLNAYEYKVFNEKQDADRYFSWAENLPTYPALLFTAMSFGLLGALIDLFKQIVIGDISVEKLKYISLPLLGILTGIVILGLSYILPTLLVKEANEIRPITLMFLCLFASIYFEKFYDFLSTKFTKIFTNK